jgi:four helix bundle protein
MIEQRQKSREFDLEERLINFSVRVIDVVDALPSTRVGNHIANQLVRSGTSPAANYAEAQGAESRRDFIHKMKLVLKELRESYIWLLIIKRKSLMKSDGLLAQVLSESNELISIFVVSIATAQKKRQSLTSEFDIHNS